MKQRRIFLTGVFALVLAACNEAEPPAPRLAPVRVQLPALAVAAAPVIASGQVRAAEELPLAFKLGGVLREMRVTAGQRVHAGARLAALDPVEIDAQVATARESLARSERDLQRAITLRAKGMVAERVEQDARTQREQASEAVNAAEFNRRHAAINAPGRGVILAKRAEVGETVGAGQPVLSFGRTDRGWVVRAGLSPGDAARLAAGDSAEIKLEALGRTLAGTVTRIAAASDPRTGTVEVEVAISDGKSGADKAAPGSIANAGKVQPAPDAGLVSGLVARVTFKSRRWQDGANAATAFSTLPLTAVLEGNAGRARVFVLQDGERVKRLDIGIGNVLPDGRIEIRDGLPPGARVVVEGAAWLSDGDAVRVLP